MCYFFLSVLHTLTVTYPSKHHRHFAARQRALSSLGVVPAQAQQQRLLACLAGAAAAPGEAHCCWLLERGRAAAAAAGTVQGEGAWQHSSSGSSSNGSGIGSVGVYESALLLGCT
jgi:hypothetical protein